MKFRLKIHKLEGSATCITTFCRDCDNRETKTPKEKDYGGKTDFGRFISFSSSPSVRNKFRVEWFSQPREC